MADQARADTSNAAERDAALSTTKPWRPNVYSGLQRCPSCFSSSMALVDRIKSLHDPALFLERNRAAVFLSLLAIDGGWTNSAVSWISDNLSNARYNRNGVLSIEVTVLDVGTKIVRVPLPPSAHLVLLAYMQGNAKRSLVEVLLASSDFEFTCGFTNLQLGLQVADIVELSDFFACLRVRNTRHLPNLIITLLSEEPGAQHSSLLLPLEGTQPLVDLGAQQIFQALLLEELPEPTVARKSISTNMLSTPPDWKIQAEAAIDQIIEKFGGIHALANKGGDERPTLSKVAADCVIAEIRNAGFPESSCAELAIRWAVYRFNWSLRPKAETVRKYLGVIFHRGLFDEPEAFDLLVWDDEDWHEFAESVLDRAVTPDSRDGYESLLEDFLSFASRRLGFVTSKMPSTLRGRSESIRRALVLRPSDVDALARALILRGSRSHQQLAAAILLGFYGGLRPKEVRTLPLNALIGTAEDLYVYIGKSKNKQSRRWVPICHLAPRWAIQFLVEYKEKREAEFRFADQRESASLFGLPSDQAPLDTQSLIVPAIRYLKAFFGKDAVFYSLRHSFASQSFIRIICLQYRNLRRRLADGHHETFSEDFLNRLRLVFAAPEFNAPAIPITVIISLARLMGHSGYATLFERYVHTLGVVLPDIYEEWFKEQSAARLSRAACKALTGLSSSPALARLPNTVGGMIDYLRMVEKSHVPRPRHI